eukprot:396731-Amphidinium_carterae.1
MDATHKPMTLCGEISDTLERAGLEMYDKLKFDKARTMQTPCAELTAEHITNPVRQEVCGVTMLIIAVDHFSSNMVASQISGV